MLRNPEDPVLISSRREAWIVFASWLVAMTWSVGYCYLNAYIPVVERKPNSELVKPGENLSNAEMIARVKVAQADADAVNAERIGNEERVEVRKTGKDGSISELWIDRGNGPERMTFVLGFPSWVFYGCVLPWWICTAFSLFFGAFIVRDEDLGQDPEQAAAAQGEVAHA